MEKVVFKTVNDEKLNLWVYDNGNPETDKNRTAILWIHGGGWNSGSPDYFADDYDYFTARGAVCFGVEYRLVSQTENDTQAVALREAIKDCVDAILYVKQNCQSFGIDSEKIVVIGESAGGHLALCFATDIVNRIDRQAVPNAVIAYNPVVETVARWSKSAAKYDNVSFDVNEFYSRYNILKSISPYHNITENKVPLLLLTGIDDTVVYPGEVFDFYEKYIAVGNKVEIELYPKTTHAFALPDWYDKGRESLEKSLKTSEKFLEKYNLI